MLLFQLFAKSQKIENKPKYTHTFPLCNVNVLFKAKGDYRAMVGAIKTILGLDPMLSLSYCLTFIFCQLVGKTNAELISTGGEKLNAFSHTLIYFKGILEHHVVNKLKREFQRSTMLKVCNFLLFFLVILMVDVRIILKLCFASATATPSSQVTIFLLKVQKLEFIEVLIKDAKPSKEDFLGF